jgi:multidrug efflux system membrane fusion protein
LITAPIDGRVGVINVTKGALVHEADQTPLLTITQMAPLRISFAVPEKDLDTFRHALKAATPAEVDALDPETGKTLAAGKLNFIDSAVDTTSGTVTVKAEFDNADSALWPGEYVKVEAELGVHRDATVVPIAAVQLNEQGSYVFLAKPDGTVATQPVTVAEQSGDAAVIGSGINPNDHVVVEGQLRLRDGSPVKETVLAASDSRPGGANAAADATQ